MTQASLRGSLYKSFAGQWISALTMFGTSLIVARLLKPDELGIYAVSLALATVIQTLQNVGSSEFVLYSKDLDLSDRRAAFGLSLMAATAVAFLLVGLAVPIAEWYAVPQMADLLYIFALTVLINALSSPVSSMFARHERFAVISAANAITIIVQSGAAIALILLDYSFYALALSGTVAAVVSVIFHALLGREFILYRPSLSGMRRLTNFSAKMFALNILDQIYNACPQILIGRLAGLSSAAMYSRASIVTQIYSQVIARAVDPVIVARIASTNRESGDSSQVYITSSSILLAVSAPFFGFIAIYAGTIVPLLFGDQWGDAILPMRILCVGFTIWPLTSPTSSLLIAAGMIDLLVKIRTGMVMTRITLLALFAAGGLPIATTALTFTIFGNMVISMLAIRHVTGMSIRHYVHRLRSSLAATFVALAAAGVTAVFGQFAGLSAIGTLALAVATTGASWFLALKVGKHPIWLEGEIIVQAIRARRTGARAD